MKSYIIKRLLATIPVLVLIAVITFAILHLAPGDPASVLLGDQGTAEEVEELRKKMQLDRPIYVQFGTWFVQVVQGDLGKSVFSGQPVLHALAERLEPTLALASLSAMLAILIAIPLGVLAAWRANTWIDRGAMILSVLGWSIPAFWLGINLIFLFGLQLRILPVMGYMPLKEGVVPFLKHLIMPVVTLGLVNAALIARMTRASMLEILQEDYIRTARAKGLTERLVLIRHALRNAAIAIITIVGLSFAALVAGVVVTETVFAIPGVGRLVVDAVLRRDYPIIQGAILMVGSTYVFINLAVDLLYTYFDPRVKY